MDYEKIGLLVSDLLLKFSREEILNNHLLKIKSNRTNYFLLRCFATSKNHIKVFENDDITTYICGDDKEVLKYYFTYIISLKYKKEITRSKAIGYFIVREMKNNNIAYMYCEIQEGCDMCFSPVKSNIQLYDFEDVSCEFGPIRSRICTDCFKFLDIKKLGYDVELKIINFEISHGVPKQITDEHLKNYKKLSILAK